MFWPTIKPDVLKTNSNMYGVGKYKLSSPLSMPTGEAPASKMQNVLRDAASGKCGLRSPAAKVR